MGNKILGSVRTISIAVVHPVVRAGFRLFARALTAAVFCCVLFAAPSSAAPEWLTGAPKRYPPENFLTGVGSADTIDASRERARAEIAKIFSAAIEQTTVETSAEISSSGARGAVFSASSVSVEQKTKAVVADTIEGVEIAQVWYDKKNRAYFSLAVLDKAKYRANLSGRIAAAEEKTAQALRRADSSESQVERLKNLSDARASAVARDKLYDRRRVVETVSFPALPDEMSVAGIDASIAETKSAMRFRVAADCAADCPLKNDFSARLTKLGFALVEEKTPGEVLVEVNFSVEPFLRAQSHWKYYRWESRFEVKDGDKTVIAAGASGSESNPEEDAARKKAEMAGLKIIGDLFERKIKRDFLGGD